nr:NADH dehydrogenase subunit 6 [Paraleptophlebia submarginata]
MLMLGLLFTLMNHPLAMGLILLTQTLAISLLTGLMLDSYWFSYILFLVFLGGMLVLFIYVTSLASNEMFLFSKSGLILTTTTSLMLLTSTVLVDTFIPHTLYKPLMMNNTMEIYLVTNMIKLYTYPTSLLTLVLILYLLLTLVAVVKITDIQTGPLRQAG